MSTNPLPLGQICRGSVLGEIIVSFVQRTDVETIVEIGAWNGCGSTRCVLDGLKQRRGRPWNFVSLEASPSMFAEAMRNIPEAERATFSLIHGCIIDPDALDVSNLSETEKGWLIQDVANYNDCPNALSAIPDKIDLLILDGGEFSSHAEFMLLKDRSRFIILDDTVKSRKFRKARAMIFDEGRSRWGVILDQPNDRGGWMLVENLRPTETP